MIHLAMYCVFQNWLEGQACRSGLALALDLLAFLGVQEGQACESRA
jgi:hypothetical protein